MGRSLGLHRTDRWTPNGSQRSSLRLRWGGVLVSTRMSNAVPMCMTDAMHSRVHMSVCRAGCGAIRLVVCGLSGLFGLPALRSHALGTARLGFAVAWRATGAGK